LIHGAPKSLVVPEAEDVIGNVPDMNMNDEARAEIANTMSPQIVRIWIIVSPMRPQGRIITRMTEMEGGGL
jgi:hypothetical protein